MKLLKIPIVLLIALCISNDARCQKIRFSTECDIIKDLLDSADQTFYNLKKVAVDSSVSIIDISGLLASCSINNVNGVNLIIINSGKEFEDIKKGDIFKASSLKRDYFVLTKNNSNGIIGYRLYHRMSNGNFYRGFIKKGKYYYLEKKSTGWF